MHRVKTELQAEHALNFIAFSDGLLQSETEPMGDVYDRCKEEDNIMYAICCSQDIKEYSDADYLN